MAAKTLGGAVRRVRWMAEVAERGNDHAQGGVDGLTMDMLHTLVESLE